MLCEVFFSPKWCITLIWLPFTFLSHLFQVQCVSEKGELPLNSAGLAALTEDVYEKTEHLFASSNVSLKRDGDTVKTEIKQQPGNLPLVLCIAVRGLASLAHCDWTEGGVISETLNTTLEWGKGITKCYLWVFLTLFGAVECLLKHYCILL